MGSKVLWQANMTHHHRSNKCNIKIKKWSIHARLFSWSALMFFEINLEFSTSGSVIAALWNGLDWYPVFSTCAKLFDPKDQKIYSNLFIFHQSIFYHCLSCLVPPSSFSHLFIQKTMIDHGGFGGFQHYLLVINSILNIHSWELLSRNHSLLWARGLVKG